MTGGTYDHSLIIGTVCSFIQGMTNTWLLHNLLIPTLQEILQKSSRKNYVSAGIFGRVFRVHIPSEIRKYETKQNCVRKLRNYSSK